MKKKIWENFRFDYIAKLVVTNQNDMETRVCFDRIQTKDTAIRSFEIRSLWVNFTRKSDSFIKRWIKSITYFQTGI